MKTEIKLLEYQNKYWKNDPEKFNQLNEIIQKNPKYFQHKLRQTGIHHVKGKEFYKPAEDNRPLLDWIDLNLPQLNGYHLATKCFWILNGIESFPLCPVCNNPILTEDFGMQGFCHKYCSRACAEKSPEKRQKAKLTCLKKYGTENPSQSPIIRNKVRQSNLKKYGVTTTLNLKKVRDAANLSLQRQDVKDRRNQTNIERYGNVCSLHGEEVHQKTVETWIEKYGVDNPNKSDIIKENKRQTNLERYGVEYSLQAKPVREKIIQTTQANYGVEYPLQSPEVMKRLENTCMDRYGVINGGASAKAHQNMKKKYHFNGIQFDSAPEIALYIWLSDNNIDFDYQPNTSFEYFHNGKKHCYFPDFRIEGFLYEIKGNHFFKDKDSTKEMICPYREKDQTDEEYQAKCDEFEAKHQCMKTNGVIILTNADYMPFVKYVEARYGKQYLKSLKNKIEMATVQK